MGGGGKGGRGEAQFRVQERFFPRTLCSAGAMAEWERGTPLVPNVACRWSLGSNPEG